MSCYYAEWFIDSVIGVAQTLFRRRIVGFDIVPSRGYLGKFLPVLPRRKAA